MLYGVTRRDVVDLNSRGCREFKRGGIIRRSYVTSFLQAYDIPGT